MRRAAAPRARLGRRVGLREPRRAGAPRARRRVASLVLDRPPDVPRRFGRISRVRAIPSRRRRRLGHRSRSARSASSSATCRWARVLRQAAAAIRLIVILNDVTLPQPHSRRTRQGLRLSAGEAADGLLAGRGHAGRTRQRLGRRASFPAAAFVRSTASRSAGPNAGIDMTFDFPTLIAHAAKTRPLLNGVDRRLGTVSNRDADGGPGKPIARGRRRLLLHRGNPLGRDDPPRRAEDAVPELRRPRSH